MNHTSTRILSCLAAMLLAGGLASVAAPKDPDGLRQAEEHLTKVRHNIRNSGMKLRNGIQGIENTAGRPDTPGVRCCDGNIERMQRGVEGARIGFDLLRACYEATDNADGIANVEFAKADLLALVRAITAFETSPDLNHAAGAVGGMSRGYNLLAQTMEQLTACPERAPEPEPKKAKKNKRKSEETD